MTNRQQQQRSHKQPRRSARHIFSAMHAVICHLSCTESSNSGSVRVVQRNDHGRLESISRKTRSFPARLRCFRPALQRAAPSHCPSLCTSRARSAPNNESTAARDDRKQSSARSSMRRRLPLSIQVKVRSHRRKQPMATKRSGDTTTWSRSFTTVYNSN